MTTKPCIACKQEIHAAALKCQHCQQIQTRAANLQNKAVFNYIVISVLGLFILWLIYYIISFSLREPLEPVFDITETHFHISEKDQGLNIRCIGKVNNPYAKRWTDFSLQAHFINADNEVIDVLYAEIDVTVYPLFHFDAMVSGSASASKNEYVSCKLSVINADDY